MLIPIDAWTCTWDLCKAVMTPVDAACEHGKTQPDPRTHPSRLPHIVACIAAHRVITLPPSRSIYGAFRGGIMLSRSSALRTLGEMASWTACLISSAT